MSTLSRKPCPSDVTYDEWALGAPYLTLLPEDASQRRYSWRNGHRYYVCLRHQPRRAALGGSAVCILPAVPARPLEEVLWEQVQAALLSPERLRAGLAAAREQHAAADARRKERLAVIDAEVARLRARLARIMDERLDAAPGSETARVLKSKAEEVEATLARLATERATLAAAPVAGLSEADAATLEQFAAAVQAGLALAREPQRRELYRLLHLRGRVRLDPTHGMQLGRRHRFSVSWDGVLELPHLGREYKKVRVSYFTDDYAEWEREHLGVVKINLEGIPALAATTAP